MNQLNPFPSYISKAELVTSALVPSALDLIIHTSLGAKWVITVLPDEVPLITDSFFMNECMDKYSLNGPINMLPELSQDAASALNDGSGSKVFDSDKISAFNSSWKIKCLVNTFTAMGLKDLMDYETALEAARIYYVIKPVMGS